MQGAPQDICLAGAPLRGQEKLGPADSIITLQCVLTTLRVIVAVEPGDRKAGNRLFHSGTGERLIAMGYWLMGGNDCQISDFRFRKRECWRAIVGVILTQ
jgi:hypothetical protein